MNKSELFYEEESKTARPHKYSINYKDKNDSVYAIKFYSMQKQIDEKDKEIELLNNIIDELEKWLNEYYESNRKWYNTELSNHDRKYYEREYRNTEFMIVKFKKQLNELKGDNK